MSNLKKRAELALIISLPETIKGIAKPGRLKNLVGQLSKQAAHEYNHRFYRLTFSQKKAIDKCIEKFDQKIQWSERPRHILSYVSAISGFIEGRGYSKINKLITEIIDYYERAGKAPTACFWSAADAEKLWNESFEKGDRECQV